jgi:prolyl-tRNA synthetase
VIGDRGLKDGKVEYQGRRDTEATLLPVDSAAVTVTEKIRAALVR